MTIKRTKIERIVIECSMQDAAKAIQYRIDHGYKMSGWAGPALSKKRNGPMLDESRYHCEGEKEI